MNKNDLTKAPEALDTIQKAKFVESLSFVNSKPFVSAILNRLKIEIPKELTYHNLEHSIDVMKDSLLLAVYEDRNNREIELLGIAAAFHDAGFIIQYHNNEPIAAELASQAMKNDQNYSPEEVELVHDMILDTQITIKNKRIHRNVSHELSRYLLDADLANLGKESFFQINDKVYRERPKDMDIFKKESLLLLSQHSWLTKAANDLWEKQRIVNLNKYKLELMR